MISTLLTALVATIVLCVGAFLYGVIEGWIKKLKK